MIYFNTIEHTVFDTRFWIETGMESLFKMRYGSSWLWYYLNWEINGEILL